MITSCEFPRILRFDEPAFEVAQPCLGAYMRRVNVEFGAPLPPGDRLALPSRVQETWTVGSALGAGPGRCLSVVICGAKRSN
ncbi:MAG: hypothetical protein AAGH40_11695 [Verrucomicrobiota bacterium]